MGHLVNWNKNLRKRARFFPTSQHCIKSVNESARINWPHQIRRELSSVFWQVKKKRGVKQYFGGGASFSLVVPLPLFDAGGSHFLCMLFFSFLLAHWPIGGNQECGRQMMSYIKTRVWGAAQAHQGTGKLECSSRNHTERRNGHSGESQGRVHKRRTSPHQASKRRTLFQFTKQGL